LKLLLLLSTASAMAADVHLEFDYPWDVSHVAGFALWHSEAGGPWQWVQTSQFNEFYLTGVGPGLSEFYATAFNFEGVHSDPSNFASTVVPPPPINLFQGPKVRISVRNSPDLLNWSELFYFDVPARQRDFLRLEFYPLPP
jgi:hypothetical protein